MGLTATCMQSNESRLSRNFCRAAYRLIRSACCGRWPMAASWSLAPTLPKVQTVRDLFASCIRRLIAPGYWRGLLPSRCTAMTVRQGRFRSLHGRPGLGAIWRARRQSGQSLVCLYTARGWVSPASLEEQAFSLGPRLWINLAASWPVYS